MQFLKPFFNNSDTIEYSCSLNQAFEQMALNNLDYIVLLKNAKPCCLFTSNQIMKLLHESEDVNIPLFSFCKDHFVSLEEKYIHKDKLMDIFSNSNKEFIIVVNKEQKYLTTIRKKDFLSYLGDELASKDSENYCDKTTFEQKNIVDNILDIVDDMVFYKDAKFRYKMCNRAFLNATGFNIRQLKDKNDHEIFPSFKADTYLKHDNIVMHTKERFSIIEPIFLKGREVMCKTVLKPHLGVDGEFLGIVGIVHDISKEIAHKKKQKLIDSVFKNTADGIVITDKKVKIIDTNDAFTSLSGYEKSEAIGSVPPFLLAGIYDNSFLIKIFRAIKKEGIWKGELWSKKKNGKLYTILATISAIKDEFLNISNFIILFSDITASKQKQEQLEFLAHHDSLTGLSNRILMEKNLTNHIRKAKITDQKVAVLCFDLDNFKEINDTSGHNIGDRLLKDLAFRLNRVLKGKMLVSRVGGDEFVVLLENIKSKEQIEDEIKAIFDIFKAPFIVDDKIFNISMTLGGSMYPDDSDDVGSLLKHADIAMYQAKKNQKGSYAFYTKQISLELINKIETLQEIKYAIKHDEFVNYYQPQIDIKTEQIIGAEALVRWQHPSKGLLLPDSFIQLSEESQDIIHIGKAVLKNACKDIRHWLDLGYDLDNFKVAINISAVQITYDDIYRLLRDSIKKYGVEAKYLELELTETSVMQNPSLAIALFEKIKNLGVNISIDDFGTGYSSLLYLKKIPANSVKIDRSFIKDIPKDKDDFTIIKAILALGKSLNLQVIAEGIEDEVQRDMLLKEGCQRAQGFLYEKPIPKHILEEKYLKSKTK